MAVTFSARSIYILYILVTILFIQVIFQQYIISSIRREIQVLIQDRTNSVELVSKIGGHLEDKRLERLESTGVIYYSVILEILYSKLKLNIQLSNLKHINTKTQIGTAICIKSPPLICHLYVYQMKRKK